MNPDTDESTTKKKGEPGDPPTSPYGPHPHGVDEAAGGADSSPYDNEPTGDRQRRADEDRRAGRNKPSDDTNQSS
ncbi:hypothetical protein GobsT_39310 [Gemmata obscuriglobus]|uniref:Uncharacterized protein n=1 Tax=Gemmata obscuriglobus TaxID=114 RepID=A0A2Z3H8G2_9BACT|nr:hypothetical protein [Gemmata obscuriglobus]AWM37994.1 hypothetical protein C1280_14005 [Gemmata obscuriglobus]QEG29142.1 hypothetical protein GobsT_39310 [Gemmata obscuriglobus]VTS07859.1 unnamed protein product [Gemmata obscuriglobus UQM 2246]